MRWADLSFGNRSCSNEHIWLCPSGAFPILHLTYNKAISKSSLSSCGAFMVANFTFFHGDNVIIRTRVDFRPVNLWLCLNRMCVSNFDWLTFQALFSFYKKVCLKREKKVNGAKAISDDYLQDNFCDSFQQGLYFFFFFVFKRSNLVSC